MRIIFKCFELNSKFICNTNSKLCKIFCHDYSTGASPDSAGRSKEKHPFQKIHPWRSSREFSDFLVKSVIYNEDGMIALNKPYGIPSRNKNPDDIKEPHSTKSLNKICNAVDYTIQDSLPYIAEKLGHEKLIVVKAPEKFMSGVTILAVNDKIKDDIIKSQNRAIALNKIPKTYWIVTTRLPKETKGSQKIGLKLHWSPCKKFQRPVVEEKWFNMEVKRGDVKILSIEFEVLSNSKDDICALIEVKSSTTKYHAIRLYAATRLLSPILGDRIHAPRIQHVVGTLMNVNPFSPIANKPPKLSEKLISLLNLSPSLIDIIPVHIHLKRIELTCFLGKKKDLVIEAPLTTEFAWTCKTLGFQVPIRNNEKNDSRDDLSIEEREQKQQSIM